MLLALDRYGDPNSNDLAVGQDVDLTWNPDEPTWYPLVVGHRGRRVERREQLVYR